jgi:hypothetical protein
MPGGSRRNADEALIAALACGATIENAARSAGTSVATANRRLKDPTFRKRLQDFKDGMVQRSAATLTAASTESVKTLLSLQQSTVPYTVRLGAARAIIELGIKMRDSAELHERIAALEERLGPSA